MEPVYFLTIVITGCVLVMFYGYKTLWARYHSSGKSKNTTGDPAPPLKKTISGDQMSLEPGDELNEKMLQWQKMYQLASLTGEAAASDRSHVDHVLTGKTDLPADILVPGDRNLSYQEFIQRKRRIQAAMETRLEESQGGAATLTSHVGRFF